MLHQYFSEITDELLRKSERIRTDFVTHKPSAGSNREGVVGDFLREYLPRSYDIGTGLVAAQNGKFSAQADLLIVDGLSNAPLYGGAPSPIWLVESVFALIEVKTLLTPSTIADAVQKCARFKELPRTFGDTFGRQKLAYSLFVLWSFEAPAHETLKQNLIEAMKDVPLYLRPDFIVVPNHSLTRSGTYLRISTQGAPEMQRQLSEFAHVAAGRTVQELLIAPHQLDMLNTGPHTVLAWLAWLLAWLTAAGPRRAELVKYVPPDHSWGTKV